MTNRKVGKDGKYYIKGKYYELIRGSRAQVMHGTAHETTGGLTKTDLKKNKHGRIVSRKMSVKAGKENQLKKKGYLTKKGVFGAFKNGKSLVKTKKNKKNKKKKTARIHK